MTNALTIGIKLGLSGISTAMTVLDVAIERAASCDNVKPESGMDVIYLQEIAYIRELMVAAYILMKEPIKRLKDTKDHATECETEANYG